MKAKELIQKLSMLPADADILIINQMGYPAYDYDGQAFVAGFDETSGLITIESEST